MSKQDLKQQLLAALSDEPSRDSIQRMSLFGSQVHGSERNESDVDVLIEFKPSATIGLFKYVQIQRRLGEKIGRKVDLVTPESLSQYFRDHVLAEAETIYEG